MQNFGLRQTQVIIRTETWTGANATGKGIKTTTDVELLPRPKVEDVADKIYRISKITPPYGLAGGWSVDTLVPKGAPGSNTYIVLLGPEGTWTRECRIAEAWFRKNFGYTIIATDDR